MNIDPNEKYWAVRVKSMDPATDDDLDDCDSAILYTGRTEAEARAIITEMQQQHSARWREGDPLHQYSAVIYRVF